MKKIAVGLSGGVDSATSAYLLKKEGWDVTGVYLVCWDEREGCASDQDRKDAIKVAMKLGIPMEILDFKREYKEKVIDRFFDGYAKGLTPNPDVWCNSVIKFGVFFDWAMKNGFDAIATGHYARIESNLYPFLQNTTGSFSPAEKALFCSQHFESIKNGHQSQNASEEYSAKRIKAKNNGEDSFQNITRNKFKLMQPKDKKKDQTYFLYRLGQEELGRVVFPLGGYLKNEVRETAEEAGLPVAEKPDSQGICFIGDIDVQKFLRRRLKEKEGEVVDGEGEVVGEHSGVWFYTIGQRGGWKIAPKFQKKFEGELPVFYVIGKDVENNRLIVGVEEEAEKERFVVGDLHWIEGEKPGDFRDTKVRLRNTGKLVECEVEIEGENLKVKMKEGDRGVAAGQAAVFYRDGECLGGGVIE